MDEPLDEPYPGPRPFLRADRERFFGRAHDARTLAELWQANRLTIAVGPVASGKTSLLQAGVSPLVEDSHTDVLLSGRLSYGSTFPFAGLPEHNPFTLALLRSWSPGETVSSLVGLTIYDFVHQRAKRHSGLILAAIDQAEDLSVDSGPRWTHRQRFLNEVVHALRNEPRLHMLIVVREEALRIFADGPEAHVIHRVTPLSPQAALQAVIKPVDGTSRSYGETAAEELVADLQTSLIMPPVGPREQRVAEHIEPVLIQVACRWLWDTLPSDLEIIAPSDIRKFGDVDTALTAHYGRVIATVADYHNLSPAWLRSWLLDTFVTTSGARKKAHQGVTGTAGMPNSIVRTLEDRHLLSAKWYSGSLWFELLSDRLIVPLQQVSDERPRSTKPMEYLHAAERAMTLGDLDVAERYAEQSVRIASGSDFRLRAEADSFLGNLAYEREKPAEAEARYMDAASLFEAVEETRAVAHQLAAVGQMMLVQGHAECAVDKLRAAVERLPHDLAIQTELALALWQLGEGRAAVAVLTSVLGIEPGNLHALRARGEILADLNKARAAMLDLDRVTLRGQPSTQAARGLALAELGDRSAARREIEDALAEAPRNGQVLLYAARASALDGDKSSAKELARRAVDATDPALSPSHREAALQLADE